MTERIISTPAIQYIWEEELIDGEVVELLELMDIYLIIKCNNSVFKYHCCYLINGKYVPDHGCSGAIYGKFDSVYTYKETKQSLSKRYYCELIGEGWVNE